MTIKKYGANAQLGYAGGNPIRDEIKLTLGLLLAHFCSVVLLLARECCAGHGIK